MLKKLVLLVIVAGLFLMGMFWWGSGDAGEDRQVVIREGSTLTSAASQLEEAEVIPGTASSWRLLARVLGGGDPIQAGEFLIPQGASGAEVLDILQHGQPISRRVTIPEGYPSILVQERLSAVEELTGDAPLPAEGRIMPDTYDFQKGDTRASVIARMEKAMSDYVASVWPGRSGDCPVKDVNELLTLASIVEKETAKADERTTVAGVYCNRLKIGMKLDADPTVIYPITKGKPLGRRIRRSELNAITGYNTYREPGLPDGPIANPGRASIDAVLHPAETKAIYFVADGTGGHIFAETLAEHNRNVAKWYEIRRKRGEM